MNGWQRPALGDVDRWLVFTTKVRVPVTIRQTVYINGRRVLGDRPPTRRERLTRWLRRLVFR